MVTIAFFYISGAALLTLIISKRREEKKKRSAFILRVISRGDERLREFRNDALHAYSLGKERLYYLITKQMPFKGKSLWNRFAAYVKETGEKYAGNMRNSKLLKKSDGISEFFKNMSDLEKGNGEIHEIYTEETAQTRETNIPEAKPVRKKIMGKRLKVVESTADLPE